MARDLDIGSQYGPYVVEEVIARGGQGVVLRTHHTQLGLPVALKLLLDDREVARRRFLLEIETLRALEHPRLPRALDLGEHEGTLFIALELIPGKSLKDLVKVGGPLSEERAVEIVIDVAETVAHCHSKGVLHRDLKPANVVVHEKTQRPYVVDFGIVKIEGKGVSDQSRLSLTGELIGTPSFMAPEQADEETTAGPPADVYGLGAILYYLLCGEKPFDGPTSYNVLARLATAPTPDVRATNPEVSTRLAEFLLRAMAKEPRDRPQTAASFAAELEQATREAPPEPRASGANRALAALLAVIGVLLPVTALVVSTSMEDPLAPPPSVSPTTAPSTAPTRVLPSPAPPSASPSAQPSPSPGSAPPRRHPDWSQAIPGAPGSIRWEYEANDNERILKAVRLGPLLLTQHAPLNRKGRANRRKLAATLLSLTDRQTICALPASQRWHWEPVRRRALFVKGGRLMAVTPDGQSAELAEVGKIRALGSSARGLYLSRSNSFDVLDLDGAPLQKLPVDGRVDCVPLEIGLEPGLDRLVVGTSGSEALLLDLEGRLLDSISLPAPACYTPTLLRRSPGEAEVVLTSGAGILMTVSVSGSKLRLLKSRSLGPNAGAVGPVTVDFTLAGEPRSIYAATRFEVLCLDPTLEQIEWGTCLLIGRGRPDLRGFRQVDFDRDGVAEVLASFVSTEKGPRRISHAILDAEGRVRHFSPVGEGARVGRLLARDSALISVDGRLEAWGPWTRLPDPQPSFTRRTPLRPLDPAKRLRFRRGTTKRFKLRNDPDLAPLRVEFGSLRPSLRATCGEGVDSADLLESNSNRKLVGSGSSYEISFLVPRQVEAASLEIDAGVQGNYGHGFLEVVITVDDKVLPRTHQLPLKRNVERVQLGRLKKGSQTIKIQVSSRSMLRMRLHSVRLVLE